MNGFNIFDCSIVCNKCKKKKKKQQTLLVLNDDDEVIVIQETYINCECKDQEIAGKNIYFNYIKTYILGKRK